jgi:hypothetical protein
MRIRDEGLNRRPGSSSLTLTGRRRFCESRIRRIPNPGLFCIPGLAEDLLERSCLRLLGRPL